MMLTSSSSSSSLVVLTLILASPALAEPQVRLEARLADPVVAADQPTRTHLKLGLTGFELPAAERRPPVSLSIVLDRSGSMSGEKLERAKEAAIMVVERLRGDDEVAVLTYDDGVELLSPIGPVGTGSTRASIIARLRAVSPGGSTALYAGVAKGAEELRRSLLRERTSKEGTHHIHRLILLSDGQANVGPASPAELARLGASLAREGITVTTIGLGLGYNEDLMAGLARAADGNHAFVESASSLARIFDAELGEITQVVAEELSVELRFGPGVRCLRALNRDVEIRGDRAFFRMSQLYASQERFVLLELQLPADAAGHSRPVVGAELSYANTITRSTERVSASTAVRYSDSLREISSAVDKDVRSRAVEAIANERSRAAVALRDQGRLDEAEALFRQNAVYLDQNATALSAPKLKALSTANQSTAESVKSPDWGKNRKAARKLQHELDVQQRY